MFVPAAALAVLLALMAPLFAQTPPPPPAWQGAVMAAIFIALLVAAFAYMVVHLMHLEQLKALVREELFQVGLVAVLAGLLITGLPFLDSVTHNLTCYASDVAVCPVSVEAPTANPVYSFCSVAVPNPKPNPDGNPPSVCPSTAPLSAWALQVVGNQRATLSTFISGMGKYSNQLGLVGSKSGFCAMLGVGFGVAGCSAYSSLRGPVGQLLNAAGMGLMDLQAEILLLQLNAGATLSLLLPLGLLLRALHFSRKVGATLIALSISLYIVFPATLLIAQGMADRFIIENQVRDSGGSLHAVWASLPVPNGGALTCDPFDP
ncbi:MAG: hypothetical protein KGH63_01710, partial [Candidatus Micrarchaeota archaeon]|nr:hypothetical protein [Candidatus Micrarchaeota archaeon]